MEFFEHKHHKPVEPLPEYRPTPPFHDHPDDGYDIPMMRPCKPYVHGLSPEEQMGILTGKVNELIRNYNENTEKVYGAYNAIVESALCNDAYYSEVTVEEGYIAEASAPYKVIHVPFLDRAKQPIFIELGLAYNNTTNANVHENVFSASERTLADKLIPAYQSTNTWHGAVVWKGAPISNIGENPADYTVGITENGFIKVYEHLMNYGQLQQDRVRNAMLANSILVQGGKMTPDKFFPDEKDQLIGRVGIGMNYDTKERFMVIVNGSDTWGCTTEMLANIFLKYNCTVAVEVANGMKTTALDKGALLFTPPTVAGDEVPTIPEVNAFWYITKRRHYHNEYVKDVASLTQKYGQMLWRCETANISVDNVKEEVANLSQKLDTEIANREEGDKNLQEQITQEVADREQGDETLDNRITQEVQTINERIDNEVQTINQLIADTKTELQNNIDTLNSKVEQYHTELDNADIASVDILQDGTKDTYRLKRKDGTYVDIPMEVYNYELLIQKLDTLSALDDRLTQEIEARKEADENIQSQIDAITGEAQGFVKKSGDTMQGVLTLHADPAQPLEAATKQYVDNTTQAAIQAESAEREKQDNLLSDSIAQETNIRTEADEALNNRVQAVEQAMTAFDNRVIVVGDTTLVSEGVNAITAGKIVLWVRTDKDPVIFSAYDADEVIFKGYTMEQPAFVVFRYENTGVAFSTGVESFSSLVVGNATDENQATSLKYVQEQITNVKNEITQETATGFLKKNGTDAMEGDLNMALHAVYGTTKYIAVNADGSRAVSLQHVDGGAQDVAQFGNAEGQAVRLGNVAAPVSDTDAVNKAYLRDNTVPAQGGAMTGDLDMAGNNIVNLKTPVNDSDAANKSYVDTELSEAVTEVQTQIEQNSNVVIVNYDTDKVSKLIDSVDKFILIKSFSDQTIRYYGTAVYDSNTLTLAVTVPLSNIGFTYNVHTFANVNPEAYVSQLFRGEASESQSATNFSIGKDPNRPNREDEAVIGFEVQLAGPAQRAILTGIREPVEYDDVANKQYVDDKFASAGGGSGDFKADGSVTATGDFNMGGHAITNVEAPTNDDDVATKQYVDNSSVVILSKADNDSITAKELYNAFGVIKQKLYIMWDSVAAPNNSIKSAAYILTSTYHSETDTYDFYGMAYDTVNYQPTVFNIIGLSADDVVMDDIAALKRAPFAVGEPTKSTHAATKKYVDDTFASISSSEVITQLTQQIADLTEQLSALTTKVDAKADASTVTALQSTVNGKANQTDLTALTTRVTNLETWKNTYNGVITTLYNG